ncbi:recombination protein RecR [Candidatus Gottesmanbacteria bacterium RIFCSPLOWO2_01_FULL_46_9]|uniref:Recombination protein RecR n=1 Tax=Candidatus Gottesmanbacteria bacterium RIFCSPLOWO2_01_FULL_46_9 TaxID=1798394 RepID=A0A1F6B040_9BACT|nr:MAG: recombination protein RecR [Candidatus Gottesmanbacteria bacterium RIFCSPLOWO2_01_FULL_46_9]
MSILPKAVSKVIESFERLPGIGPKTAQRLAFYLLHVPQDELDEFAGSLTGLKANTVLCAVCKNVAEADPCAICSNPSRDASIVCVVEQPTDVLSIERTGKYHGLYHVLHGAIDPLNNIGPEEIYIADLIKRISSHVSPITEIILALNPNMEGEATSMYIQKQILNLESRISKLIKVTRLAHGLPIGADIEYADEVTLTRALEGRREY